jgi:hypothetical protein
MAIRFLSLTHYYFTLPYPSILQPATATAKAKASSASANAPNKSGGGTAKAKTTPTPATKAAKSASSANNGIQISDKKFADVYKIGKEVCTNLVEYVEIHLRFVLIYIYRRSEVASSNIASQAFVVIKYRMPKSHS